MHEMECGQAQHKSVLHDVRLWLIMKQKSKIDKVHRAML